MAILKDNSTANKLVLIGFIVYIITTGFYYTTNFLFVNAIIDSGEVITISNGQIISAYYPEGLMLIDDIALMLALVSTLFLIVVFLVWFYRAYHNLIAAGTKNLPYSSAGWTIGGFFIPFVNLYMPVKIMSELWHETQRKAYGYKNVKNNSIVILWWSTIILSLVVLYFSKTGVYMSGYTIIQTAEIKRDLNIRLIGWFLRILSAVFALIMIKKMSTYEKDFHRKVSNEGTEDILYDDLRIN